VKAVVRVSTQTVGRHPADMSDTDIQIVEVQRKIDREKLLINGATHMRQSTNNAAVQARADSNIKDGRRNIAYLEEQLKKLQLRKVNDGAPPTPQHGYTPQGRKPLPNSDAGPTPPPKEGPRGYMQDGGYGDPGPGGYSQGENGLMPPRAPYPPGPPNTSIPKARPNFSKLGKEPQSCG